MCRRYGTYPVWDHLTTIGTFVKWFEKLPKTVISPPFWAALLERSGSPSVTGALMQTKRSLTCVQRMANPFMWVILRVPFASKRLYHKYGLVAPNAIHNKNTHSFQTKNPKVFTLFASQITFNWTTCKKQARYHTKATNAIERAEINREHSIFVPRLSQREWEKPHHSEQTIAVDFCFGKRKLDDTQRPNQTQSTRHSRNGWRFWYRSSAGGTIQ